MELAEPFASKFATDTLTLFKTDQCEKASPPSARWF